MEVDFDDADLDRLETDAQFTGGFSQEVVRAYRKKMHFEKLKGKREGQHSIRLNMQWRLVFEIRGGHPCKVIGIIEIVDYH